MCLGLWAQQEYSRTNKIRGKQDIWWKFWSSFHVRKDWISQGSSAWKSGFLEGVAVWGIPCQDLLEIQKLYINSDWTSIFKTDPLGIPTLKNHNSLRKSPGLENCSRKQKYNFMFLHNTKFFSCYNKAEENCHEANSVFSCLQCLLFFWFGLWHFKSYR